MVEASPVRISSSPMTLEELLAVADGAPVEITEDAIRLMAASRGVVDEAVRRGDLVYGVTTGVGHARNDRLPATALREIQPTLLEMHVGGTGPALPRERVRAGMAARLNGFARGGAGVSLPVARGIAALLNHGIQPVMPGAGSVGAGDLGQLALLGQVLLGRGEAEVGGRSTSAADALSAAGLAAIELEPKDALAIMSSNALSVGHGALLLRRLQMVLALADLVAATSMEATYANPSILDPAVAAARGSSGQQMTSDLMRRALQGSARTGPAAALSVQDPLSFRVVPQVHGACRDVVRAAADAISAELNAAADNPMVDVAAGRIISNGNFHCMNLALAADSVRIALGHVGLLAERRMGHLWDAAVTAMGMPGQGSPRPPEGRFPAALAGLGLRYPAAALYTRLRQLASSVTLDVPVLDLAVEDHAPNTAEALRHTEDAVAIVEDLLVIELLIATVPLARRDPSEPMGPGTDDLVAAISEELDHIPDGTLPHEVHQRMTDALRDRLPGVLARLHATESHDA